MKSKLAGFLATVMMLSFTAAPAYAVETVDFSDMLLELKTLMEQCEERGIPTDYEMVNYSTIERFEDYINEDIQQGLTNTDYTIGAVNNLYNEAKSNLEAYLSGEKQAFEIEHPDMSNLQISDGLIYDGDTPVFSIGYGHFARAKEDIPNFQKFGASNIQMEIGPVDTINTTFGWNVGKVGNVTATAERTQETAHTDTCSVKIVNSTAKADQTYITLYKTIECKPNTKYKLGCWSKGEISRLCLSANGFNNRNWLNSSNDWTENVFYYTTSDAQTKLEMRMVSDDITTAYLDDFFLYELGTGDKAVSDNLLANPGAEELYNIREYSEKLEEIKNHLQTAEENNIAASLLLSPHYFPSNLPDEFYSDEATFIGFNINEKIAKEIVESHIRTVIPAVKDCSALDSIILSNEPHFNTNWYSAFYTPLFRSYLKTEHGSIEALNEAYGGTSYEDFDDINMPADLTAADQLCYDWMEFNDKTFAEWHEWMAGIVKEYDKKLPVSIKALRNFWQNDSADREYLAQGVDYELFGEFSDYAGHDGSNIYDNGTWFMNYYASMFSYDFYQSLIGKPPYNSEEHIIRDGNENFSTEHTKYVTNHMWQASIHGRAMSTIWVWDRNYNTAHSFWGSILFRPDAVAGVGKVALDSIRLSKEIAEIQQNSEKVAIYYSKPSRLYSAPHFGVLQVAYRDIVNGGFDCGVVSDRNLTSLYEYDTLIVPYATNCKAETLEAIETFIEYGGKVYYTSYSGSNPNTVLGFDEYNNALDNRYFLNNATYCETIADKLINSGKAEITLIDESTSETPEMLDWQYSITDDRILIDITSLDYSKVKNISVYFNSVKLEGMKNLITNTENVATLTLNGFEPQLLEYDLNEVGAVSISDIGVEAENSKIYWTPVGELYESANIYYYNSVGNEILIANTSANEYTYSEAGIYKVCPVRVDGKELDGKLVTVFTHPAAEITVLLANGGTYEVSVTNLTDNYLYGAVCVEYLDANEKVLGYGYGKTVMRPDGEHITKVSVPVPENAEMVRIAMYDDIFEKNITYSEVKMITIEAE